MNEVYLYAIGGNLTFAMGSMFFTHYARKVSSIWMNFVKALVAAICFMLFITLTSGWSDIGSYQLGLFLLSGLLGLGIGDIFLLKGFSELGPGRSLMLFGFQPLILGILGFIFLGQDVNQKQLLAIIMLIFCLLTFSIERLRFKGHWDLRGLVDVLLGVLMDAIGVILTRRAFELDVNITSWEGNFYRCLGALAVILIINQIRPIGIVKNYQMQDIRSRLFVLLGSLLGTFLSLGLYLKAVQTGHLASISAISITGSLFSSAMECIYERKWPSKYLLVALVFFLIGSKLLLF